MTQVGKVTAVYGGVATVEVRRASACGENCAQCRGGCSPTKHSATAKNTAGAAAGDMVRIETPDSAVLRSAMLVYFLPIIILFICYGIAQVLFKYTAVSVLAGLFGLCAGFFILRAVDRKNAPIPEITEIIHMEGGEK